MKATQRYLLAVVSSALISSSVSAQSGGGCLPRSAGASHVRDAIARIVSSRDTLAVRFRADNKLPAVDSSQVSLVRDSTTCARASLALARVRSDMDPNHGAWVVRVGETRFVAFNGVLSGFEHSLLLVVYDTTFVQLSTFHM